MLAHVVPRAVGCGVRQAAVEKEKKSTTGLDGPFQPTSARQLGRIRYISRHSVWPKSDSAAYHHHPVYCTPVLRLAC
jgi:hypothetical protein